MKFKKTITTLVVIILVIIFTRLFSQYAASYLDNTFVRDNGKIVGTNEYVLEKGDSAVILIHGIGGNPYSMKEIATYLYGNGLSVYAILLPGHGTSVFDLEKTTWRDWQDAVEKSYQEVSKKHKKVYVLGYSLGSLLALDLASRHDLDGVIVINAPIKLIPGFVDVLPIVYLVEKYHIRGFISFDELPLATDLKLYQSLPIKSVFQLVEFKDMVSSNLNKINEKILVIQSVKDDVVDPESAVYIINNIESKDKDLVWLTNSTHIGLSKKDKVLLKERSARFFK